MSKKALPYPRPVSPLDIDEIPISANVTLYYEPDEHEADEEAQRRAAKRRKRVRDNAEAYLRGEPICIMTAGLRGPFDATWKNPWAKKRTQISVTKEVPETNAAHASRKSLAVPETTKVRSRQIECIDLTEDDIEFTQPHVVKPQLPKDVFKRANISGNTVTHRVAPSSANRVEEWLKTNDAYKNKHTPDIRSSPTPTNRKHRPMSASQSPNRRPLSAGGANDNTQVGDWAKRFSSGHENDSSQQTHESQDRAEVAIAAAKRRSVHRVPPSTNLPAFEYKRPKRLQMPVEEKANTTPLTPDPSPESATDPVEIPKAECEPQQMSEQVFQKPSTFMRPPLSAETSKATTIVDLPAAQVVSVIEHDVLNAQSTAELLQPVEPLTEHDTMQKESTEPDLLNAPYSRAEDTFAKNLAEVSPHKILPQGISTRLEDLGIDKENKNPLRNIDTQALLGSIQPFAVSTIKKMPAVSKINVSKTKPNRSSKKKASFAPDPASDESQSSIKAGFQVRKSTSINILPAEKASSTNVEDECEIYGLDPPTGLFDQQKIISPSKKTTFSTSKLQARPPPPKGILKTRAPNPTPYASAPPGTTVTATGASLVETHATYQSTSGTAATKQDAQSRPRDMFAIENGTSGMDSQVPEPDQELQNFDLDEVVDELGSFLGTWDVEREVGGLV